MGLSQPHSCPPRQKTNIHKKNRPFFTIVTVRRFFLVLASARTTVKIKRENGKTKEIEKEKANEKMKQMDKGKKKKGKYKHEKNQHEKNEEMMKNDKMKGNV